MPVDSQHPQYRKRIRQWRRCRDAVGGTDAVRDRGEEYLPRLDEQSHSEYDAYLNRATFYNGTKRTVGGLTGAVFRKAMSVDSPVKDITSIAVTRNGSTLDMLAQHVVSEVLTTGRVGLLLDVPKNGGEPYIAVYDAEDIVNWDDDGQWIVLKETIQEQGDDEFDREEVEQYRVLQIGFDEGDAPVYMQRIFHKPENTKKWVEKERVTVMVNGSTINYIPFCFVNPTDNASDTEEPPLLDLVDMNLSHYRSSADLEHGAHFTALPTAWVAGFPTESELRIGSTTAWISDQPQARAGFLEYQGQGLGALSNLLESKERKMAVLGSRLLEEQKKAAETAETHRIRVGYEAGTMIAIVKSVDAGMTKMLQWLAEWMRRSGPTTVDLNKDFVAARMTPQELIALMQARQAGEISQQTFLWNLEQGELLPPGTTPEDERVALEVEGPTNVI